MFLAAGAVVLLVPVLLIWPRWWLSVLHIAVLALMLVGAGVDAMALVKIVSISVLALALWRYGLPRSLDRMDRAWLAYVAVQLIGLVSGVVQGREPATIAVSAWFFLQPPLYWFAVRYLLDVDAVEDNLTVLAVAASAVTLWSVSSEAGAVVGAAVIGGYLSHLVLPFSLIRATYNRNSKLKLAFAIISVLLLIDILAGGSRRFWIAAFAGLIPFFRRQKFTRQVALIVGVAIAIGVVLLINYEYIAANAAQGVGYRNIETFELISEIEGIEFLTGLGYGYHFDAVMPWGVQSLGPGAHNYYAAMLLNTGALGLVSFLGVVVTLFRELRRRQLTLLGRCYVFMYAGWLFAAIFARPTDGLWVLGLFPALAAMARFQHGAVPSQGIHGESAGAST